MGRRPGGTGLGAHSIHVHMQFIDQRGISTCSAVWTGNETALTHERQS